MPKQIGRKKAFVRSVVIGRRQILSAGFCEAALKAANRARHRPKKQDIGKNRRACQSKPLPRRDGGTNPPQEKYNRTAKRSSPAGVFLFSGSAAKSFRSFWESVRAAAGRLDSKGKGHLYKLPAGMWFYLPQKRRLHGTCQIWQIKKSPRNMRREKTA